MNTVPGVRVGEFWREGLPRRSPPRGGILTTTPAIVETQAKGLPAIGQARARCPDGNQGSVTESSGVARRVHRVAHAPRDRSRPAPTGRAITAQGNALGIGTANAPSPERAN
jgi:hypothetical protein